VFPGIRPTGNRSRSSLQRGKSREGGGSTYSTSGVPISNERGVHAEGEGSLGIMVKGKVRRRGLSEVKNINH